MMMKIKKKTITKIISHNNNNNNNNNNKILITVSMCLAHGANWGHLLLQN